MDTMALKTPLYSYSAMRTYEYCQKQYYFQWLATKKQGWRKDEPHPWHQIYKMNQITSSLAWAGNIYHQVISEVINRIRKRRPMDLQTAIDITTVLIDRQFAFSTARKFKDTIKSNAQKVENISIYLALFEHFYDLPLEDLRESTREKLRNWLINTFDWRDWPKLVSLVRDPANQVHIEPIYLYYSLIEDIKIPVRMDLGIELPDGTFMIFDWKCHNENIDFIEYNMTQLKRQLLIYAMYCVMRDENPLSITNVTGYIFNPIFQKQQEFNFSESEKKDFELAYNHWVSIHTFQFTEPSSVNFDFLDGPRDPQKSCPWCAFKGVCGSEITWSEIQ